MNRIFLKVIKANKKIVKLSVMAFIGAVSMFGASRALACSTPLTDSQSSDTMSVLGDTYEDFVEELPEDSSEEVDSYEKGKRFYYKKDYLNARDCFIRAAQSGNEKANFYLGFLYLGLIREKDESKAKECFGKVLLYIMKRTDAESLCMYGDLLLEKRLEKLSLLVVDEKKAFACYKKAAEQGCAEAQYKLGVCYETGCGIFQNIEEAAKYYKFAADQGYAEAQCSLGRYFLQQGNVDEAIKMYIQAANQGYAEAQCNLGWCYADKNELSSAIYWYYQAANQGHAEAQCELGRCYETGYGVAQDLEKAVKYYTCAARQGCAEAQYNLGVYYLKQGLDEGIGWLKKSAEQGDANAQYCVGDWYYDKDDLDEAKKWYFKAATNGVVEALYKLGRCYEKQGETDKALKWYEAAVKVSPDVDVYYHLGICYFKKDDVIRGRRWIEKASEKN